MRCGDVLLGRGSRHMNCFKLFVGGKKRRCDSAIGFEPGSSDCQTDVLTN